MYTYSRGNGGGVIQVDILRSEARPGTTCKLTNKRTTFVIFSEDIWMGLSCTVFFYRTVAKFLFFSQHVPILFRGKFRSLD